MVVQKLFEFVVMMMVLFSNDYTKAQGNIILTGKVLDEKSKEPLAYASISVAGKPVGTD